MKRVLILAAVVISLGALAQTERSDLERLRRQISQMESRISALGQRATTAREELEAIEEELKVREEEVALADRVLATIDADRRDIEARIVVLEDERRIQSEYLGGRMVALYKTGRLGYLKLLLSGSARPESIGMLQYLIGRDARMLDEFRSSGRQLELRRSELETRKEEAVQVAEIVEERRAATDQSRARHRELLRQIEIESAQEQRRLAELREKAERLARLLTVITTEQTGQTRSNSVREFRGALSWPVRGRLLERFGRQRSRRFATFTMNNGIRISQSPGAEVRAVFSGTVLYASPFKGYGNLVIVDHGDRVFTLYGNTKGLRVEKGERVQNGQVVALVSEDEDGDGGALYFEVRVDNQPVDPLGWLR